jgi:hypothetical protein
MKKYFTETNYSIVANGEKNIPSQLPKEKKRKGKKIISKAGP